MAQHRCRHAWRICREESSSRFIFAVYDLHPSVRTRSWLAFELLPEADRGRGL